VSPAISFADSILHTTSIVLWILSVTVTDHIIIPLPWQERRLLFAEIEGNFIACHCVKEKRAIPIAKP